MAKSDAVRNDEENGVMPPAKKIKLSDPPVPSDVVSPAILSGGDSIKAEYKASKPFSHAVLKDVFNPDFTTAVMNEIKYKSKVTFKETDLFRVFQSIDMANLDPVKDKEKFPAVLQLRSILYSPEWRALVEKWTGLDAGTLTDAVDCAANCHAPGCHLLCHDDVIGTRKVSYILHLTAENWTDSEGGALELYDSSSSSSGSESSEEGGDESGRRVPDAVPSKTVLPSFNSMAFFEVQPGISFHSVQEVLGDRPRLTLQGWYHAAAPPDDADNATLQRLKDPTDAEGQGDFSPCKYEKGDSKEEEKGPPPLSEEDRSYLKKYLREEYLTDESMAAVQMRFEEDSSVQLQDFLTEEWKAKIDAATEKEKDGDDTKEKGDYYQRCVSSTWKLVGPAHKQRFLEYENDKKGDDSLGGLLQQLRGDVLQHEAFWRWLGLVSSLSPPIGQRGRIRRFRPGLDYTVAHHGLLTTESVLDATLCFVKQNSEDEDKAKGKEEKKDATDDEDGPATWYSGDCGGFECYIDADDDDDEEDADGADGGEGKGKEDDDDKAKKLKEAEADAEYNAEDDGTELLSVSASNNTLSLVYRDPGTLRFVKFVGSKAPSSRWDIAMEYRIAEQPEEESEKKADK